MLLFGMVFGALAAILHLVIFYMESIDWEGPLARKTFGGTPEEARPHAFYAYNQGFYNLFLALEIILGIIAHAAGFTTVGVTLMLAGAGSMFAAALVLWLASPQHRQAALKQGTFPFLTVLLVLLSLVF